MLAWSAIPSAPATGETPTIDFPNDSSTQSISTLQHDAVVTRLRQYASPRQRVTVAGTTVNSYAQRSSGNPAPYAINQESVSASASTCLADALAAKPAKPAIVLDIDETSVSNLWYVLGRKNLAADSSVRQAASSRAIDPAIEATKRLYKQARDSGAAVFFISGRNESTRSYTERNLRSAGYKTWQKVVLEPTGSQMSSGEYKTAARKNLRAKGWSLVLNVGDQSSDLNAADGRPDVACSFKLPNPYYAIPW